MRMALGWIYTSGSFTGRPNAAGLYRKVTPDGITSTGRSEGLSAALSEPFPAAFAFLGGTVYTVDTLIQPTSQEATMSAVKIKRSKNGTSRSVASNMAERTDKRPNGIWTDDDGAWFEVCDPKGVTHHFGPFHPTEEGCQSNGAELALKALLANGWSLAGFSRVERR